MLLNWISPCTQGSGTSIRVSLTTAITELVHCLVIKKVCFSALCAGTSSPDGTEGQWAGWVQVSQYGQPTTRCLQSGLSPRNWAAEEFPGLRLWNYPAEMKQLEGRRMFRMKHEEVPHWMLGNSSGPLRRLQQPFSPRPHLALTKTQYMLPLVIE